MIKRDSGKEKCATTVESGITLPQFANRKQSITSRQRGKTNKVLSFMWELSKEIWGSDKEQHDSRLDAVLGRIHQADSNSTKRNAYLAQPK